MSTERILSLWADDEGTITVVDGDGHQVAVLETDLADNRGPLVTSGLVGALVAHKVRLHLEEARDSAEAILKEAGINTSGMP